MISSQNLQIFFSSGLKCQARAVSASACSTPPGLGPCTMLLLAFGVGLGSRIAYAA